MPINPSLLLYIKLLTNALAIPVMINGQIKEIGKYRCFRSIIANGTKKLTIIIDTIGFIISAWLICDIKNNHSNPVIISIEGYCRDIFLLQLWHLPN